jgi:hypothetical protein
MRPDGRPHISATKKSLIASTIIYHKKCHFLLNVGQPPATHTRTLRERLRLGARARLSLLVACCLVHVGRFILILIAARNKNEYIQIEVKWIGGRRASSAERRAPLMAPLAPAPAPAPADPAFSFFACAMRASNVAVSPSPLPAYGDTWNSQFLRDRLG